MVQRLHKRKSSFSKSLNGQVAEVKSNPSSPVQEKKFSLLRKKSTKEKSNANRNSTISLNGEKESRFFSIEYVKSVAPKLKPKHTIHKVWKSEKLFDAVAENNFDLTRKLIFEDDIDLNEICPDGNTVLHIAAAYGNVDCVNMLLESGANVNIMDAYNRTPIEYAVFYGNYDCASALVEYGADTTSIKDGIS